MTVSTESELCRRKKLAQLSRTFPMSWLICPISYDLRRNCISWKEVVSHRIMGRLESQGQNAIQEGLNN